MHNNKIIYNEIDEIIKMFLNYRAENCNTS